jgi:carboxymethylenebutenolidase
LQPKYPIDVAKDLKVPVLGLYGESDAGIPLNTVQQMREELNRGKSKSEIIVYPKADHGFHADYRPSYNKQASQEAWTKMLAWFKKHGAA